MSCKVYTDQIFNEIPDDLDRFYGCLFVKCAFSHGTFNGLNFASCSFINCAFAEGVSISNCRFSSCVFFNNYIENATFVKNRFSECSLSKLYIRTWSHSDNVIDSGCVGFFPKIPSYGAFYGYKVIQGCMVVRLLIPADAKRSTSSGGKCRASYAIVDEIMDYAGQPMPDEIVGYSYYDPAFEYRKGETLIPSGFTPNPTQECGEGIHFFLSFEEAVNYGKH